MMQHDEPSPLLVLPPELKTFIFANLEATDLAKLTMACSHLATFIRETPELQYKIELAICGMVNGPSDGPPLLDRLQSLRKYREACEAGDLPDKAISPPPWPSTLRKTGTAGVVVYFSSESMLVIHRPASAFSGITEKTWTITPACLLNSPTYQFPLESITVDVSQDLVILTKIVGGKVEGHVLSLSRHGAPHPLAENSMVDLTVNAYLMNRATWGDEVEIEGDLVRWQFQPMKRTHDWIEVWNWKSGRIVWKHELTFDDGLPLRGCHILDSSHILASDSITLFVYDIAHTVQEPPSSPTEARALLRLRLPSTADGVDFRIDTSQLQRSHSSTDGEHSFHGDPSLAVLALRLTLDHWKLARLSEVPVVLVPLTTIHGLLRHFCSPPPSTGYRDISPVDLEWDAWGPSGARMIIMKDMVESVSSMGSQCAIVYFKNSNTRPERGLFVLDVHARSQLVPADKETLESMANVDVGECLEYPDLFESPIHTTLPYSLSKTPGRIIPRGDPQIVQLLQDTILHIGDPLL